MSGLKIRPANEGDLYALLQLQRSSSESAQWREDVYRAYIAAPVPGDSVRRCIYLAQSEEAVGFVAGRILGDSCELENIVVQSPQRRSGIGFQLLYGFIAAARKLGAYRIQLEVRASNVSAIALYTKCGFQQEGLRKSYYSNPEEDAILFSLSLKNSS